MRKQYLFGFVLAVASISLAAPTTYVEEFNNEFSPDLAYSNITMSSGICRLSTTTWHSFVGFKTESLDFTLNELLSGSAKVRQNAPQQDNPYFIFMIDTNGNGRDSEDLFLVQNPPINKSTAGNGWSTVSFNRNSLFSTAGYLDMQAIPAGGQSLNDWSSLYGDKKVIRAFVELCNLNTDLKNYDLDNIAITYGTPEPQPATVPAPGAMVLGLLGVGLVGRLGRHHSK